MSIPPDRFRQVMGAFATGVTVVAFRMRDGRPAGLTVNAFTSVSLRPTLVLVCIDHATESFPEMQAAPAFAVNVLAAGQEELSRRFASKHLKPHERFEGLAWRPAASGAPFIDGCLAHLDCRVVQRYEGGDHAIFLAEVDDAEVRDGEPLLFYRGQYGGWTPRDASAASA
jgi:flavin reductase (DIM6/NTAB) family NADH-FMN oxidoreductase RutF